METVFLSNIDKSLRGEIKQYQGCSVFVLDSESSALLHGDTNVKFVSSDTTILHNIKNIDTESILEYLKLRIYGVFNHEDPDEPYDIRNCVDGVTQYPKEIIALCHIDDTVIFRELRKRMRTHSPRNIPL